MKEQLEALGFEFAGLCRICRNQFEDWIYKADRSVIVKMRIDYRRAKIIIGNNTFWVQAGAGGNTPLIDRIDFILKQNNIVKA